MLFNKKNVNISKLFCDIQYVFCQGNSLQDRGDLSYWLVSLMSQFIASVTG